MTALASQIRAAPQPADPRAARRRLDELLAAARDGEGAEADAAELGTQADTEPVRDLLLGIAGGSPYLWDLCRLAPARLARLLARDPDASLVDAMERARGACATAQTSAEAMSALRRLKQEASLLLALCDLGGVWDVARVTDRLTRVADMAVGAAMAFLLGEAARANRFHPQTPEDPLAGCGLVALAMGKHGAFELNYSSDIDLIILYDPENSRLADGIEPGPFFVRLTQGLVRLLAERTHEGYVFRVDLRLRPDPGSTAVAIALPAAFAYYETAGQNWERAAMIKARACAGDIALGEAFLAELRPFVWRRHLDYAAIADIHAMKRQIQIHKGHHAIAVAGHDLKLGRGGIREIEFFVQTQQLIAGGRNPVLRGRRTTDMLAALASAGWISARARDDLTGAYLVLRSLEHRLQMVADEQTHALPADRVRLADFARFAGFRGIAALEKAVTRTLRTVQEHYAGLFEAEPALASPTGSLVFTGKGDDPETVETIARLGYGDPQAVVETVRGWHFGRYAAMRSARAREDLTALTPVLLEALARVGRPDDTLQAFDRMLSRMPAGFQFFSILRANTGLMRVLARILGVAPRLAEIIAARPHALDGLLDPATASLATDVDDVVGRLSRTLSLARDHEDILDRARVFVREQIFQIGARVIAGEVPAARAGRLFSVLAEASVRAMLSAVTQELERAHGIIPGGRVVVLGMGKLGGREMTAASDLDLIVLYDHPPEVTDSTGPRPVAPATYYARLTQRLIAALSAPTAEGTIYAVDLRLRPSGRKGPVAIHLDAFRAYQTGEAWTWEHMALTRGRVVAGDATLAGETAALIETILRMPRDRAKLLADVREMRALIAKEKGESDVWDIKLAAGGLLDIEFIVQGLQLRDGMRLPGVFATNSGEALERLHRAGSLTNADAGLLREAFDLYSRVTQVLRLCLDDAFDPTTAGTALRTLVATAADQPDIARLEATLRGFQIDVRQAFSRILAGP
ncbi:MAG: bifunctional [glutamine synthetase] adenylyltransferase/[glutamine synthetase]-adenylyl-L-tyrosine phosphorylase [Labrys sp. (in: a-proteobacteria)]